MLDTPFGANDDSLVPDPGDKKDPCIKTIDLTVQKIWNDDNNENGSRPAEIKVKLWQQAYNENGEVQGQRQQYTAGADPGGWFIISVANHGRADSATWTRVIEGLPVVVQDEQTQAYTYYTYEVEEAPVIGYNSNITHNETSSTPTATITTCLLFCGAVKYNNDWKVSTNCLIYYNGKAINNTDTAWTQGGVS